MSYTMAVAAIDGGVHQLPADTVTFDTPPRTGGPAGGPLLPLAFRSSRDVFYVRAARWPELGGKALQLVDAVAGVPDFTPGPDR
jgi:hypothetical protein